MSENRVVPIDWLEMFAGISKELPADANWIAAINVLADLLEEAKCLTDEQQAILTGLGAMMYRQGLEEMQAGIGAQAMIKKLMVGG